MSDIAKLRKAIADTVREQFPDTVIIDGSLLKESNITIDYDGEDAYWQVDLERVRPNVIVIVSAKQAKKPEFVNITPVE